jgi:hypothetical protein
MLEEQPDQFVGVLPDELRKTGISDAEQVLSTSSRVTVRATDSEPMMTVRISNTRGLW